RFGDGGQIEGGVDGCGRAPHPPRRAERREPASLRQGRDCSDGGGGDSRIDDLAQQERVEEPRVVHHHRPHHAWPTKPTPRLGNVLAASQGRRWLLTRSFGRSYDTRHPVARSPPST